MAAVSHRIVPARVSGMSLIMGIAAVNLGL